MSIHYRHLLKPTGQPNLTMTSNQLSSERLKQIEETAERLGVSVDELVGTLLDLSKSVVPQDHQSQEYYEHWTDFTLDIAQYFLESLPVAAVVIDKDGRIVTVNVQAVDVFQYEREELINKPLEILLPERFRNAHEKYRGDFFDDLRMRPMGEGLELFGLRKDGTEFPIEVDISFIPFDREIMAMGFISDITTRYEMDRRLRQDEERLRQIIQTMPVMMDAFDENGLVVVWNQECEIVTGFSAKEIIGNPHAMQLLYPDDAYRKRRIEEWDERGNDYRNWEWDITCKSGETRTIAWSNVSEMFPIPGWAMWGIGIDVSERKLAEQQAMALTVEQERTRVLREFIRGVSHEFRTPLSVINTSLYLAERSKTDEQRERQFGKIAEQADGILRLVDALVIMSHLDSGIIEPIGIVNFNTVINNSMRRIQELYPDRTSAIHVDIKNELPSVLGNSERLEMACVNLLDNALRYSDNDVHVTAIAKDSHIRVEFRDQGIGISAEDLPLIFEKFFRVDKAHSTRGFGLGLSIAQRIIENHGGTITVESTPDEGSMFAITFPVASPTTR
jgi:PAS domain S-box-containing protein